MATIHRKPTKTQYLNPYSSDEGPSSFGTPDDSDSEADMDDDDEIDVNEPAPFDDEDVGLTVSEGEEEYPEFPDIPGDENPNLMRYLHHEQQQQQQQQQQGQDINGNDGIDDDSDQQGYSDLDNADSEDSSIEQEEEQHILDDMNTVKSESDTPQPSDHYDHHHDHNGNHHHDDFHKFDGEEEHDLPGPDSGPDSNGIMGATLRRRRMSRSENRSEEEDSDSDDFFDDFFEPTTYPHQQHQQHQQHHQPQQNHHYDMGTSPNAPSDEDDSYLWEYFFSSGDESSARTPQNQDRGDGSQPQGEGDRTHSGDSTDEDTDLPPAARRPGQRASEVLGSNLYSTRPPVLGQWNIDDSQGNVGIIDGLTTRTLSPPPGEETYDLKHGDEQGSGAANKRRIYDQGLHSDSDVSDVDLEDFIYTEELSDQDDESAGSDARATEHVPSSGVSPYIYRSRFNHGIPGTGFRGAKSAASPYAGANLDHRRTRRRSFGNREVMMSPVRSLRKRPSKKARTMPRHRNELDQDLEAKDLIEELVEMGAITPLFDI